MSWLLGGPIGHPKAWEFDPGWPFGIMDVTTGSHAFVTWTLWRATASLSVWILFFFSLLYLYRTEIRCRRINNGRCVTCGYEVHSSKSAYCSECGSWRVKETIRAQSSIQSVLYIVGSVWLFFLFVNIMGWSTERHGWNWVAPDPLVHHGYLSDSTEWAKLTWRIRFIDVSELSVLVNVNKRYLSPNTSQGSTRIAIGWPYRWMSTEVPLSDPHLRDMEMMILEGRELSETSKQKLRDAALRRVWSHGTDIDIEIRGVFAIVISSTIIGIIVATNIIVVNGFLRKSISKRFISGTSVLT